MVLTQTSAWQIMPVFFGTSSLQIQKPRFSHLGFSVSSPSSLRVCLQVMMHLLSYWIFRFHVREPLSHISRQRKDSTSVRDFDGVYG